jgi:hypothetical protein
MTRTLFDRFSSPPATHPLDTWLTKQNAADWKHVPGFGLVGPESTPLTRAFEELPDWDEFVEAVRADLRGRCRLPRR